MKEFTSCFVGIPLPDEYLREFSDSLERVSTENSDLEIVDPATPHMTIYYLDKQSQNNLEEIRKVVEGNVWILKDANLEIGGMDTFGDELPWVLFLPVSYPSSLAEFNNVLASGLSKFMAEDDNLPFHPHMTVARFNVAAQNSWGTTKVAIKDEMTKINWQFPITEVVIYGVDSTVSPQHQEKLIRIPI